MFLIQAAYSSFFVVSFRYLCLFHDNFVRTFGVTTVARFLAFLNLILPGN